MVVIADTILAGEGSLTAARAFWFVDHEAQSLSDQLSGQVRGVARLVDDLY